MLDFRSRSSTALIASLIALLVCSNVALTRSRRSGLQNQVD